LRFSKYTKDENSVKHSEPCIENRYAAQTDAYYAASANEEFVPCFPHSHSTIPSNLHRGYIRTPPDGVVSVHSGTLRGVSRCNFSDVYFWTVRFRSLRGPLLERQEFISQAIWRLRPDQCRSCALAQDFIFRGFDREKERDRKSNIYLLRLSVLWVRVSER